MAPATPISTSFLAGRSFSANGDRLTLVPQNVKWLPRAAVSFPSDSGHIWLTDGHLREDGCVGLLLEPRELHPENYDEAEWRMTSRPLAVLYTHDEQALKLPAARAYPMGGTRIHSSDWRMWPKSKAVSIVASPKRSLPGHLLRHQIIEAQPEGLDVFGPQFQPIDHKIRGLAPYMFTLAIENVSNGVWFTEQLLDALLTFTVPLWWGSPGALDTWGFDRGGIIQVTSADHALTVMRGLGPHLYQTMLPAVKRNFVLAHQFTCLEDWLYQRDPLLFR